ncbi:MAG TPA: HAD-IA family hydrolase [Blastocatellia bacterium]|jgi:sugar-phosphatase|nr:HAD-IA family hydrolase [Blastocatellia bacterium]
MIKLTLADGQRRHAFTCEAILFDMDGTLVDSTICVESTWRIWAARHNLDIEKILQVAHGRQNHETIRLVAPRLETPEEIAFLIRAEEECQDGIIAVPGARDLVDMLPVGRWAVVTSAWRRLAEIRLKLAGLPLPATLITSDEIERGKPHPDGYLTAAARLGIEPAECLVFEDAPAGIEAAMAAGMNVVGVKTTFSQEELICEWCIDDFKAISITQG